MVYAGPLIIGFILGFILGSRIKPDPESKLNFTLGSFIVIILAAIIMAYLIGPFPYYTDASIASGFVAGIVGIITGKITLGRDYKANNDEQI